MQRRSILAAALIAPTLVAPVFPAAADKPLIGAVMYARDSQFWQQWSAA